MKTTANFFAAALLLASAGSVLAAVRYVDVNSASNAPPYTSWATAATNIQDAVDAAVAGDEIVVANGIYATGGLPGNRVTVDKPLSLRSINGPQFTSIDGGQSVRCVYLTNGASLSGFTLTNGFVLLIGARSYGGGVFCESTNAVVSNCVVSGNSAVGVCLCDSGIFGPAGGGVYGGTLNNCILGNNRAWGSYNSRFYGTGGGAKNATLNGCTLSENSAALFGGGASGCTVNNCALSGNGAPIGGGAAGCTLNNCTLGNNGAAETGGGADSCTLNKCTLSNNRAYGDYYGGRGGGAAHSTLNNCTLSGNSAEGSSVNAEPGYGGGAAYSTLNNCTLSANRATESFPGLGVVAPGNGGGAWSSTLNNCIVYFNTALQGANYDSCTLNYSCTTPQPTSGSGNITNVPLLVDQAFGNLRLHSNSPCINAGLNAFTPAGLDLDGNPRIKGDTLDIGAYEFQSPISIISYAWLQQYALPIASSTDTADPDGDGLNNWQEWHCATDPANALSALRLLVPVTGGTNLIVTWQSVTGVNYFLERSTAVSSAFTPLATSLPGQPGTTTYTDTNAIGAGPWFYRVGVIVGPQDQSCLGPSPGPEYRCVNGVWTEVGHGRL
jgi:hypothetical protein